MKKRTVVFVRSKVSGKVAIVHSTSVLVGMDQTPFIENLDKGVEFTSFEFDGSNQVIVGVMRSFWVAELTQADFHWLIRQEKASYWEGSVSFVRQYKPGLTKELIILAFENLPEPGVESNQQKNKQVAA